MSVLLPSGQGLESCLKGPDNYNSQVLIEATVIALTKLQPLLSKVGAHLLARGGRQSTGLQFCPFSGQTGIQFKVPEVQLVKMTSK